MDSHRFDSLTRTLTAAHSRRRALGALSAMLGLGLGGLFAGDAESKKKCPACKRRNKKGKCKPKANGTVCATGTCQGGRCVAPPFCADKPDFTDCGSGNQCSGSVCATPPTCRVDLAPCPCCPGITCDASDHCACAPAGAPCRSSRGCCAGTCVGFSCQ